MVDWKIGWVKPKRGQVGCKERTPYVAAEKGNSHRWKREMGVEVLRYPGSTNLGKAEEKKRS